MQITWRVEKCNSQSQVVYCETCRWYVHVFMMSIIMYVFRGQNKVCWLSSRCPSSFDIDRSFQYTSNPSGLVAAQGAVRNVFIKYPKACTSPRNLTWFTKPFLLMRGWGLGTRLKLPFFHLILLEAVVIVTDLYSLSLLWKLPIAQMTWHIVSCHSQAAWKRWYIVVIVETEIIICKC